jgi:hypothetical protein
MSINIIAVPVSFVTGTTCGVIVGWMFDTSIIQKDPLHFATGFPSGVTIGMYTGGTLGVISDLLIHDKGITGGIIGGIIGGVGGLFAPKRV